MKAKNLRGLATARILRGRPRFLAFVLPASASAGHARRPDERPPLQMPLDAMRPTIGAYGVSSARLRAAAARPRSRWGGSLRARGRRRRRRARAVHGGGGRRRLRRRAPPRWRWRSPHGGARAPVAGWLVGLPFVLLQIEFEVGEGRTRPVQLVLVADAARAAPGARARAGRARATCSRACRDAVEGAAWLPAIVVADAWFALGPALVVSTVGVPDGFWAGAAAVLVVAVAGADRPRLRRGRRPPAPRRSGSPMREPAHRVRVGLPRRRAAHSRRRCSRPSAAPTARGLSPPCCRSPRCSPSSRASGRGRIENARGAPPHGRGERGAPESIVQNSSDLIAIVEPRRRDPDAHRGHRDGVRRGAPGGRGRPLHDYAHPDDAPLLAAAARARRAAGTDRSPARGRSGGSAAPTAPTATWRPSPRTCSTTPRVARHRA